MFLRRQRRALLIATVIFAMPPVVRLTSGHQDWEELVEAPGEAQSYTLFQLLFKVQLPNALPSIMAGINQTIMLSLSVRWSSPR